MTRFYDMDGVLVDFLGGYRARFGFEWKDLNYKDRWELIRSDPTFFRTLPTHFNNCVKYRADKGPKVILTSCPEIGFESIAADKLWWIRNMLGDPHVRVNFSRGGARKSVFCQFPTDTLIDDHEINIAAWRARGGVGILCRDEKGWVG